MSILKIFVMFGFAVALALLVGLLLFDAPLEYGLDCNRFAGVCTFSQRLLIRSKTGQAKIGSLETEVTKQNGVCDGLRAEIATLHRRIEALEKHLGVVPPPDDEKKSQ